MGPSTATRRPPRRSSRRRPNTATPGRYTGTFGDPAVGLDLAVTTRTGLARITFPATHDANVVFKIGDSATGSSVATVRVVSDRELTGSVTSGDFCDIPGSYTLYFDAQFDRPFHNTDTWNVATVTGGRTGNGPHVGATVSFDATRNRTVMLKVGISFVSGANARANLTAENPGWDLSAVAAAARKTWDATLDRIAVAGGTHTEQETFYSALYHSLLHPNVFSDDNGEYPGFDGKVHTAAGYAQYANFSGWDSTGHRCNCSRSCSRSRPAT